MSVQAVKVKKQMAWHSYHAEKLLSETQLSRPPELCKLEKDMLLCFESIARSFFIFIVVDDMFFEQVINRVQDVRNTSRYACLFAARLPTFLLFISPAETVDLLHRRARP